jgi:hypothetical protein
LNQNDLSIDQKKNKSYFDLEYICPKQANKKREQKNKKTLTLNESQIKSITNSINDKSSGKVAKKSLDFNYNNSAVNKFNKQI